MSIKKFYCMTCKTLSLFFKKSILLDQNIDSMNDFITLDKINLVYYRSSIRLLELIMNYKFKIPLIQLEYFTNYKEIH